MMVYVTHALAALIGAGLGAYLHYRLGSTVKNPKAEVRVQQEIKKP